MTKNTGIVNIRGKEYQTVALRVQTFREKHPAHSLITSVVYRDPDCVVMLATIADEAGRTIATGHAEEYRSSSQINKTSALENAETSAIGRALAAFGMGGTEFASANEVETAIHQQSQPATINRGHFEALDLLRKNAKVRWDGIYAMLRDAEKCDITDIRQLPVDCYQFVIDQLNIKISTMEAN